MYFTVLVTFAKLLLHLGDSVGPDGEVLLVADGGDPRLGPALVLLDRDDAREVRPVLEN